MKKYILILISFLGINAANGQIISSSDFASVNSGSFTMGNASYARESPARSVSISTFYMSKNTITNAQFAQFVNAYGSETVLTGDYAGKPMFVSDSWGIVKSNGTWAPASGYEQFPAIKVTWYGANEFCKYVGGRLPTEAEWEYAAKGGSTQLSYTYSGSSTATTVAWFYDNSSNLNHAVGGKTANSIGLYDMSGNVYQWCSDWFGRYGDFGKSGDTNPVGPTEGYSKVIRGGYRSLGSGDLHLTNRESLSPDESYNFVGFRVVKSTLTGLSNVEDGIKVFPNPASTNIQIKSSENIDRVELLDAQGRLVKVKTNNFNSISTGNLSNGMYLVKIHFGTKTSVKKIEVIK